MNEFKSGLATFKVGFILQNNYLKVKKKLHKIYAVSKILFNFIFFSSFVHILFSFEVYQSTVQTFSQCKVIHLLVKAPEQDEKFAGIRFNDSTVK